MLLRTKKTLIGVLVLLCAMLIAAIGALFIAPETKAAHAEAGDFILTNDTDTFSFATIEEAFQKANTLAGTSVITMNADATVSSSLEINNYKRVELDLNGCVLAGNAADGNRETVINTKTNSTFTLKDSKPTEAHTVKTADGKDITVYGGVITGNKTTAAGGAIMISGTFTMNGGNIVGNTGGSAGGVDIIDGSAKMTMTAGSIVGNAATVNRNSGAGIYNSYGSLTLSGAVKIKDNYNVTTGKKSNVYLADYKTITVSGALKDADGNLAEIGVTLKSNHSGTFTSRYGTNNKENNAVISPETYFTSDENGIFSLIGSEVKLSARYYWDIDESGKLTITANAADVSDTTKSFSSNALFRYTADSTPPWHDNKASIKTAEVKSGVAPLYTSYWFYQCSSLSYIDLTGLDTSKLITVGGMFHGCSSLSGSFGINGTSVKLGERFNMQNVTSTEAMFQLCGLKEIDFTGVNVGKNGSTLSMSNMFSGCYSLNSVNFSSFNAKITSIGSAFYNCGRLSSVDLSPLDCSQVSYVGGMFYDCGLLNEIKAPSAIGNTAIPLPTKYNQTVNFWDGEKDITEITSANAGKTLKRHDKCTGGTATCVAKAVCDICGQEYGELAAHRYGAPTCDWNEHSCTVTLTCRTCEHIKSETVAGKKVTIQPTCTAEGYDVWTAKFENIAFPNQTTTDNIQPALGHDYKQREWIYNTENNTAAISFDCYFCNEYFGDKQATLKQERITLAPNCNRVGSKNCTFEYILKEGEYRADRQEPKTYVNTVDDVEIPKNPNAHDFSGAYQKDETQHWHVCKNGCTQTDIKTSHIASEWIVDTPAQIGIAGSKHKECTVCGYTTETEEIPAIAPEHRHTFATEWTKDEKGHWHAATCEHISQKSGFATHTAGEWIVDTPAQIGVAGSKHKECTVCGYSLETAEIPALVAELQEENKVIVTTPEGFTPDIELVVTEIAQENYGAYETIADTVNGEINLVYDVTLKSDGVTIQPDGTLTIKLRIPENLRDKDFKIFHLHESEATDMEYTVDGNYAVVNTDKLSEFIFVGEKTAVTPAPNDGNGLSAGAIAGITIAAIIAVLLAVYIALYFTLYRKGVLKGKAFDMIYVPMNAIFNKKTQE